MSHYERYGVGGRVLVAMPLTTAAMKRLAEFGLTLEQILEVSTLMDSPVDLAAEKRRAYDRERKAKAKERNSTGNSTGTTTDHSTGNSTGIPPENGGLARVRDITSTSVDNPRSVVVVLPSAEFPEDDWPAGDLCLMLAEAANSPRLCPAKSHRLVTSAGRIAAWRREGASWVHDVLPVVTAIGRQQGMPIHTWGYFDGPIAQSIADRRKALSIPEARHERSDASPRNSPRNDRLERMLAGAVAAVDRS